MSSVQMKACAALMRRRAFDCVHPVIDHLLSRQCMSGVDVITTKDRTASRALRVFV